MFDWNDLRYFLAVARSGSTLSASRNMKVSQATVSRRITVLEEAIGVQLFVRTPAGYRLTPRGEAVLGAAEAVEDSICAFTANIAMESRRLAGTVRLTTVESAANAWVIPALGLLRTRHPDIRVEVITTDDNLDLLRGDADLALRFGTRPTQEALIVRHLMDMEEAFYASEEMAERCGLPADLAELCRFPLVLNIDRNGFVNNWVAENLPDAQIVHRANTLSGLIASVRSGIGASVLPCLMGDDLRGVVRLLPPIAELKTPGWMVTTDEARRQPHIRAVIDFVVDQIQFWLARRTSHMQAVQAA